MMNCLVFVVGLMLLLGPRKSKAQPAGRVYRIGVLERTSPPLNTA